MESQEAGGRSVRTVKLWIKAFIPSTYERAVVVPGTGAHAGKTMVTGSWVMNRCFLTDQRSFSSDIHADARMHSEIEIDVTKGKEIYQFHHCYDTIEIDPHNGIERCRAQGDTSEMRFYDFKVGTRQKRYTLKIKAGSKNPCIRIAGVNIAPNLDYLGSITVVVTDDPSHAIVTFSGKIEKYPAFEMYASANDGEAQTLFQVDVAPDSGVGDLPGAPERSVSGKAELIG